MRTPPLPKTQGLASFICLTVKVGLESNCLCKEARKQGGGKDSEGANAVAVKRHLLTASHEKFSDEILDPWFLTSSKP